MAIGAIATAFLPFVDRVLDMIPNPEAREKAKRELTLELVKIESEQMSKQVDLNMKEAEHPDLFVAGWRPYIGWVGGMALTWAFIIHPILEWVVLLSGYTGPLPELDVSALLTIVLSMLGVGTMRSYDKLRGTDTRKILSKKL